MYPFNCIGILNKRHLLSFVSKRDKFKNDDNLILNLHID